MKTLTLLSLFLLSSPGLFAQECTQYWYPTLETNPLVPKGHSGDTAAAYIGMVYSGDPTLKFVMKGNFPEARFMSFEIYQTRLSQRVDSILDYKIEPDAGSENPFREGVSLQTPNRAFTLQLFPKSLNPGGPNSLSLPENRLVHSFLYRIYAPFHGKKVTNVDLPRLYAYDAITGAPRACPTMLPAWEYLELPQILLLPIPKWRQFELRALKLFSIGANEAVPNYLFRYVRVDQGHDVVMLRFKAPIATNIHYGQESFHTKGAETRYWSMCFQNVVKNITLACLPDYNARVDANGWITLLYGRGKDIEQKALVSGYNFIEDTRDPTQKVLAMLYRNILPSAEFKEGKMYSGDYKPRGLVCSRLEFLSGNCRF